MTVNTKQADRRTLTFESFQDVLDDLDTIEAAHNAGTLHHNGNWNPGQVCWHCAVLIKASVEGFPNTTKLSFPLRLLGKLLKKRATSPGTEPPTGFKIPVQLDSFVPPDDVTFEQGVGSLREWIRDVGSRAKTMDQPSPLFGAMSHEKWTNLHVGHCQMHLSFLRPA